MLSWRHYLVGGSCAAVAILAAPPGFVRDFAYLLVSLTGILAIVVGVRRNRPRDARAWYLMGTGIAAWAVGDAIYSWYPDGTLGGTSLLLSDLFYLAAYPGLAAGLLILVRSRGPERGPTALLDSSIFTVAAGLLSWVYLVQPTLVAGGERTLELAVAVSYPLGDVLLFAMLVRLATAAGTWNTATRLLASSITALIVADSLFEAASFTPALASGVGLLDPIWLVAYVLWGAAALHPSMVALSAIAPDRPEQMQVARMLGLTAALVTGPVIVAGQLLAGVPTSEWSVVIAGCLLGVLVLARMVHLVQLSQRQAERLRELADRDFVTGLANGRKFADLLAAAVSGGGERAPGDRGRLIVLLVDLERFAELTDTLGHRIGDEILHSVGVRLIQLCGRGATVARTGDHTFSVLVPHPVRTVGVGVGGLDLAGDLRRALEEPLDLDDVSVSVEVAVGAFDLEPTCTDPALALHRADVALSAAKDRPVRTAYYGTELESGGTLAPLVIGELRGALEAGDIVVYYQPQVEIGTGRVFGVEALSRWQHPVYGLLGPDSFIQAAERTGMIGTFTQFVLDAALEQCARWRAEGLVLTVAVNLSVLNLLDRGLVEDVQAALDRHGLSPTVLELELTEGSAMVDPRRSRQVLGALSGMGVTLSIDDYGTGYSSLAYLQKLPVRRLKIDRSFVAGILDDAASAAIVRSTVELARHLGLDVIAEGVEDDETLLALRDMQCHAAQGFGLGRPVPGPQLPEVVRRIHDRLPSVLHVPTVGAGR
ncbi:GGDEF domain-containing phosphodiesterase [Pengzhenrongella sicca]|uniref:EAL domain-containing protein n=1 Tax=Pengzhenrongella sicca TaxID=2819238 RepID=A0A8A4Z7J5_9MICO|nr:GGDEF domain-containing phosphodiesterase [Pengzhenrongella sicca]QTE27870.1 EAL domain-containing protein [Pengzhenrongella sicca]